MAKKTIMLEARSGSVPDEVRVVAREEEVDENKLRDRLGEGRVIIPRNLRRLSRVKVIGIGEGLSTKVNVNVGTSSTVVDLGMELEKTRVAARYGADTIMDLSIGGDLVEIRRALIRESEPLPFGTVPTYQVYLESAGKGGSLPDEELFFKVIEEQLRDGVDFMTIHAGISRELAEKAMSSGRVEPVVSRGGAMLAAWMLETGSENPYLKNWDYLLELFAEYDAVISLGDALRPGSIVDALDDLQIAELVMNSRLLEQARRKGVQAMIEGPGHVPLSKIAADVRLMKSLTRNAPYYVLGPLVTDMALGYDHIASAIGAAIAAAEGADFICYLTPAEHLSLPTPDQVKEGLIAAKIAAHAGDLVKLGGKALQIDLELSRHRARLDWDRMIRLAHDPEKAEKIYGQFGERSPACNMCGNLCVFLILSRYLKRSRQQP